MIHEKASAKINIGLDIKSKRGDGYHDLDTIMQTVLLHDDVFIKKTSNGVALKSNNHDIPLDENNLAHKAAVRFLTFTGINSGIYIELIKNIPVEAGLAGGSSDAAAVIRGLDRLFETNLTIEEKRRIALDIGSDVPFCIEGGTKRAFGRGNILKDICPFKNVFTVIVRPEDKVSTKWAFSLYKPEEIKQRPDMDIIQKAVADRNLILIKKSIKNVFEEIVFPYKPVIKKAKYDIMDTNPSGCSMTGSGSALFSFYDDCQKAEAAYKRLVEQGYMSFITSTC